MSKQATATKQATTELPKASLLSITLRSLVQNVIDDTFNDVASTLTGNSAALFKCLLLDSLSKHITEQRSQLFDSVTGDADVMFMVSDSMAGESRITEFGPLALQLSKSKAPETLDAKSIVTLLRTSYGKTIDKALVDAFIDAATKVGEPRKTFKIIQL